MKLEDTSREHGNLCKVKLGGGGGPPVTYLLTTFLCSLHFSILPKTRDADLKSILSLGRGPEETPEGTF